MKVKEFIKKRFFIRSFREIRLKDFLKIVLFDFLFILSLIAIIALFTNSLRFNMGSLRRFDDISVKIGQVMADPSKAQESLKETGMKSSFDDIKGALNSFLYQTIGVIIICLILFALASGLLKGKGYSLLTKKRFNKKFFIKFSINSLIWFVVWTSVLLAAIVFTNENLGTVLAIAGILAFLFTTPIFFVYSTEKSNFFDLICNYYKHFILRIYRFIIPLILAIFLLWLPITILLFVGIFMPKTLYFILLALFLFLFNAWLKNYLYVITKGDNL